jgi:hypothetical protein
VTDRHHDRYETHIAEIKKAGAVQVRAVLGDGSEKVLAIPKGRNKWSALAGVLERLPWDRLEALDAKGSILAVVEADDEVGDDDGADEEMAPSGGQDARIAKVMFALMKATMAECRKMFEVNLTGMAKVVNTLAESVSSLQQVHEMQMRVQMAAGMASQGSGDGEIAEMLKLVMPAMMMQKPQAPQQMRLPNVPRRPPAPPVTPEVTKP